MVARLRKTIELAVFSDEHLYRNFPQRVDSQDKSKLVNYILTMVNAVSAICSWSRQKTMNMTYQQQFQSVMNIKKILYTVVV